MPGSVNTAGVQALVLAISTYTYVGTTQPQLNRKPVRGEQECSFSPHDCHLAGRPQAASLVQGLRPRSAPPCLATVFILPQQYV